MQNETTGQVAAGEVACAAPSSVSFRPGDPCRNAFRLHDTQPASAAWRFWNDLTQKPAIQGRGSMFRSCAGLVALSSLLLSGAAFAQEKIKVGVTATLEGTYTVLGEDGIRGLPDSAQHAWQEGRRQGTRIRHRVDGCDARFRGSRRAQADRAGQGPDPALAALRRRRHRGQEFCQDPPGADLHQRRLRRAGDDLCRSGAELLPLQHGRRAMAGRARQIRV